MSYSRPEDQYKIPKAKEMIKELEAQKKNCKFTHIVPYKSIIFNGHEHAGVLVHRCSLEEGHKGNCVCENCLEFKGYQI